MITILYGQDRVRISREVEKILGKGYEVHEGADLGTQDLVNICKGWTIFERKRRILIRDLTGKANAEEGSSDSGDFDPYAELTKLLPTEHEIVIWETNAPRRKSFREFVKLAGVSSRRFDLAEPADAGKVFEIYDLALVNGEQAVAKLKEIEDKNDPYMFFGLLASQAIRKYNFRRGGREKRVLLELAELDMQMKTAPMQPWRLIEAFLMRLKVI